jgi:phosphoglycerate dehydrogenase-like enzyme
MQVVLHYRLKEVRWNIADADLAALRARFPSVTFVSVEDDATLPAALADAEVYSGWNFPPEAFSLAPKLRWINSASAGVEANLFPALVESEVILTNAAGLHSVNIPEHCLAMMLSLARNFPTAQRLQEKHEWNRWAVIAGNGGIRELAGSNLAVIGAGAIGLGIVKLGAALDMRVRVLRRRPGEPVPGAEAVVGPQDLHALLGWADFVVLAAPLTAETTGMIDAAAVAAMRSSTIFVNVGRGELVDDDALIAALQAGGIAAAGLDVFREEPLPADSPYWALENALLTPHVSGYRPDFFARIVAMFEANLARWVRGEPLVNVVDKRLGYVVG